MRIKEVMTDHAAACGKETTAAEAAEMMWADDCGALPVVEDGRAIGIVTDRDLFIALATSNRAPSDLRVGEAMHGDLACCRAEDDVKAALHTMAERRIRRLPVVDTNGVLQGMVSISDMLLQRSIPRDEVVNTMQFICDHPKAAGKPPAPHSAHATA